MLHGEKAAQEAESAAQAAFVVGGVSSDLPTHDIERIGHPGGPTTTALLRAADLVSSNGEARRKMAENAVRVNDEIVTEDRVHDWSNTLSDVEAFKVQVGKKRVALVRPV